MPRKPLLWKLFRVYFGIALLSALVFGFFASNSLRDFYHTEVERDLVVRTQLIQQDIQQQQNLDPRALKLPVSALAKTSHTRITVINTSGKVLADSEHAANTMENHADRPEVRLALKGKIGRASRLSPTLGMTMVYVGVPIMHNGKISGVLRSAVAANALDAAPVDIYRHLFFGASIIALLAAAASLLASRTISIRLTKLKESAARFADGDFTSKVPSTDIDEFASLADTLNNMAGQLDQQLKTITRQSSEQQAILSSMKEAVVAIDNNERVLIVNPAAELLLDAPLDTIRGKMIQAAIRNPDLQRLFERAHNTSDMQSCEIVFRGFEDKIVQAVGSGLVDAQGHRIGVLVVMNDITQTRKLETMRKDFVANVSHELRTPITSIKGFMETLRDGSVDDPAKEREFMDIVIRQADRLDAIIEDLLALSAIEQKAGTAEIEMQRTPICEVLHTALHVCGAKARAHETELIIDCPVDLEANINAPLLEQAITNLLDNAIKYNPGGKVSVMAEKTGGEVVIRVTDTGAGIAPEHLPRLFERFYRVDKARSRQQGGTGLGLAIVKHIIQAHQGRVEVQSQQGKGSTFSIYLPESKG